jgi:peptide/nickel transport system permease protein
MFFSALGAPILAPYDANAHNLMMSSQPPSTAHLLGTDVYGRDLLSRLIYGARVSLGIGLSAAFIAASVGVLVGVFAGFMGGWVDWLLMRIVDVLMGFPRLVVMLLAVGFGTPSIWLTLTVLGLLAWMEVARIVRGEVMVIREMLYLKSAQALGLKRSRIITGYILPNVIGSVIVSTTLLIGTMILVEASLSFLGLGVQPPNASWGTILNQGRVDPVGAWWISAFGGLMVVVTVIGFNLLGDGLRDLLDPNNAS